MNLITRTEAPGQFPSVAPNGCNRDELEVFHVTFDPDSDPVGELIVEAVAAIQNRQPQNLDPLYETIDTEALDGMLPGGDTRRGFDEVSFVYERMEIMVESSGELWLQWL